MIDWLLRLALALLLLLVIFLAARGVYWLLLAPPSLLVQPFDMVRDGKIDKSHGVSFARLLAHEINNVDRVLTADLDRYKDLQGALIESPAGRKLEPIVEKSINVDFRPFDFDVVGLLQMLYKRLARGDSIAGVVTITAGSAAVYCEHSGRDPAGAPYGPWSFVEQGDMSVAARRLAREIALRRHAAEGSALHDFSSSDFSTFLEALAAYQESLKLQAEGLHESAGRRLQEVEVALTKVTESDSAPGLAHSYLASVHMLRQENLKALEQLREAVALRPEDPWILEQIERLETLAPSAAAAAQDESLAWLLDQPALKKLGLTSIRPRADGLRVRVGVLSTGIEATLPQFAGRLGEGKSFVESETQPDRDRNGHGVWVASLIAAIAPNAQLIPVKVLSSHGSGPAEQVYSGIRWSSMEGGCRVLAICLGGRSLGHPEQWKAVVDEARSRDVLLVAAAGNEGKRSPDFYPAATSGTLSVGGLGPNWKRAAFSDTGDWVNLYAPAVNVQTLSLEGQPGVFNGNSFACAIVAGIAARLLAEKPDMSVDQLEELLRDSAAQTEDGLLRVDPIEALARLEQAAG